MLQLFAVAFFVFLCFGTITPFFVGYTREYLKLPNPENVASNALLALTVAGAIVAYPTGLLADKIGHRRVLKYGSLVFAVGLLTIALIGKTSFGLYAGMAIIGVGYIGLQITSFSILAEIVPAQRLGEFIGLMNLFISLPQFIGNNVMGYVIDSFGYGVFMPIAFSLMLVATILTLTFNFKRDVTEGEEDLAQLSAQLEKSNHGNLTSKKKL